MAKKLSWNGFEKKACQQCRTRPQREAAERKQREEEAEAERKQAERLMREEVKRQKEQLQILTQEKETWNSERVAFLKEKDHWSLTEEGLREEVKRQKEQLQILTLERETWKSERAAFLKEKDDWSLKEEGLVVAMDELVIETESLMRKSNVVTLIQTAVGAVSPKENQVLPSAFIQEDEEEVLATVRAHSKRHADASVSRALELSRQYSQAWAELARTRVLVEDALDVHDHLCGTDDILETAVQDTGRDKAYERLLRSAQELDRACQQPVLSALSSVRNEVSEDKTADLQTLIDSLEEAQGKEVQGPEVHSGTLIKEALEAHDVWVQGKQAEAHTLRQDIEGKMRALGVKLHECGDMLQKPERARLPPPDVHALMRALQDSIMAQESWALSLLDEYQPIARRVRKAAVEVVRERKEESWRLSELERLASDAAALVGQGERPDEKVLTELKGIYTECRKADREVRRAGVRLKEAEEDLVDLPTGSKQEDNEEYCSAREQSRGAHSRVHELQKQQASLWRKVYELSSCGFPELPSRALSLSQRAANRGILGFADSSVASMLAPVRTISMYENKVMISSAVRKESRHNVFIGQYEDAKVCLKEFDLGAVGQGDVLARDSNLRAKVCTFQHELASVNRLQHDHVIKADLFFLEAREHSWCAYVQYPFYPLGSMNSWLGSMDKVADASKIRVVLGDALKGLEHVHYYGIVHCDVKPANVLVEERDGQFRGILSDFDLSKDENARKSEVSMSVKSMSVMGLARGTPGALTMAPEVVSGRQPSAASDVFSFGGMVLSSLYESQAEEWLCVDDGRRWSGNGSVILNHIKDGTPAKSLLGKLLHKDPSSRLTSSQAAADTFFNADLGALALLANLEEASKELELATAEHAINVEKHAKHTHELAAGIAKASADLGEKKQDQEQAFEAGMAKLLQQREELQRSGAQNVQALAKIREEESRLKAEKEKCKAAHDQEAERLRKEKERLAREGREEKNKLAVEKKMLDERFKEVAKKEAEVKSREIAARVPRWWKYPAGFHIVQSKSVLDTLEKFMRESCCCPQPKAAKVVRVERIENEELWKMYQTRRTLLLRSLSAHSGSIRMLSSATPKQPGIPSAKDLEASANELYLFHGTSTQTSKVIAEYGFDERVANLGGLYGAGSYFAANACKSHQYSAAHKDSQNLVMMVCRVTMGWAFSTTTSHPQDRRPPLNSSTPGRPFDSIFAEHGVAKAGQQRHNEYVVFDKCQVYPEYLIQYQI